MTKTLFQLKEAHKNAVWDLLKRLMTENKPRWRFMSQTWWPSMFPRLDGSMCRNAVGTEMMDLEIYLIPACSTDLRWSLPDCISHKCARVWSVKPSSINTQDHPSGHWSNFLLCRETFPSEREGLACRPQIFKIRIKTNCVWQADVIRLCRFSREPCKNLADFKSLC